MPVTKRSTTKSTATGSVRLDLTKSIDSLDSNIVSMLTAIENIANLRAESLKNFVLQIEEKRQCLEELEKTFETTKKDRELDIEQSLREFGRKKAAELLETFNEVPIDKDELADLRARLQRTEESHTADIEALKKKMTSQHESAMKSLKSHLDLEYRTKEAENVAKIGAKEAEVKFLMEQIGDLRQEVGRQRKLTEEVAKSSSVVQTFSSKRD